MCVRARACAHICVYVHVCESWHCTCCADCVRSEADELESYIVS